MKQYAPAASSEDQGPRHRRRTPTQAPASTPARRGSGTPTGTNGINATTDRPRRAPRPSGRGRSAAAATASRRKPAGNAASRPNVCGIDGAAQQCAEQRAEVPEDVEAEPGDPERGALRIGVGPAPPTSPSTRRSSTARRPAARPSEPAIRRRDIVRPYTPLRAASSSAPPSADAVEPPAPITLTAENCDAPVNTSSDITQACSDRARRR